LIQINAIVATLAASGFKTPMLAASHSAKLADGIGVLRDAKTIDQARPLPGKRMRQMVSSIPSFLPHDSKGVE
jgi:hypothetical protein